MPTKYEVRQTSKTSYEVSRQPSAFEQGAAAGAAAGTAIGLAMAANRAMHNSAVNSNVKAADKAFETNNLDGAIRAAKLLVADKDKEAKVIGYYYLASAELIEEDYATAVGFMTKAIELLDQIGGSSRYPEQAARFYLMRGATYLEIDELQSALRDLTAAVRLAPQEADNYLLRGRALRQLGDFRQALDDLNAAIRLDPSAAANYLARGHVHAKLNLVDEARADFDHALALDRRYTQAYIARGELFAAAGNTAKAIEDFNEALRLEPGSIEAYKQRAAAYRSAGDSASAAQDDAHIATRRPIQEGFERYLKAAHELYDKGGTVYPRATTNASFSWVPGIVLSIILAALIAFGIFLFSRMFLGSSAPIPFVPIIILLTPILVIYGYVTQRSIQNKAIGYWNSIDGRNRSMPGFSSFYEQYLAARSNWDTDRLRNKTQQMIEVKAS